ncbi:MAG: sigma-E factor negative regulatory protein [Pseudomonadota bacterium]
MVSETSISDKPAAVSSRQELLQTLSAMMDDEAENLELRRAVKAATTDQEITATWGRYHAVRASLHQEMYTRPRADLLTGIKGKLAAEPALTGKRFAIRSFPARMLKLAGQGAIAASVAAAVLVGTSLQTAFTESAPAGLVAEAVVGGQESLPALNGDFSASQLTRTVSMDAAARGRLEQAVRNYSGTSAVLNTATTPMLRNQLEPFTGAPIPVSTSEPPQNGR